MSADELKIRVTSPDGTAITDEEEDAGKLPENPEMAKLLEEAMSNLEKRTKAKENPSAKADAAADAFKKERESLQTRIKDLHMKIMEKDKALEEKTKEAEGLKDQAARRQADLENFKKRSQKERADFFNYGNEDMAKEFLHILDNLERALAHGADAKGILDGIELTRKAMVQAFVKFGVEPIKSLNEKFDPTKHQAVAQRPTADFEPGTVMEEHQKGYMLKDRLLRPSMVVVAGAPVEHHDDHDDNKDKS